MLRQRILLSAEIIVLRLILGDDYNDKFSVLFGGRSVEHEISIISAVQAMQSLDTAKYDVIPIYIAKDGGFYTGSALMEISNYKNMPALIKQCQKGYSHT